MDVFGNVTVLLMVLAVGALVALIGGNYLRTAYIS